MKVLKYVWPLAAIFLLLGVALYWVNPYAPWLLVISLVVQAPIVYLISKFSYSSGYSDRAFLRREKFEKDENVEEWLQKEQQEAESFGFRLLSARTKAQNVLLRADLLLRLGRGGEAALLLGEIEVARLDEERATQYHALKGRLALDKNTSVFSDENSEEIK